MLTSHHRLSRAIPAAPAAPTACSPQAQNVRCCNVSTCKQHTRACRLVSWQTLKAASARCCLAQGLTAVNSPTLCCTPPGANSFKFSNSTGVCSHPPCSTVVLIRCWDRGVCLLRVYHACRTSNRSHARLHAGCRLGGQDRKQGRSRDAAAHPQRGESVLLPKPVHTLLHLQSRCA